MTTHIHTDGSCHGNPGPGGWAAVILTEAGRNLTLRGSSPETTNNIMELTAVIRGLRALEDMAWELDGGIVVHTDSRYVSDAFLQDWVGNWQRNGWRTANRQPVKNRELWEELILLVQRSQPSWVWVKGHSGEYWNELCDQMANDEADRAATEGGPQPEMGIFSEELANKDRDLFNQFFGAAASEATEEAASKDDLSENDGPEEAPGAYNRGWRDGYEAARQDLMQVLQSMERRP